MISKQMTAQFRREMIMKIEALSDLIHRRIALLRDGEDRIADFIDQAAVECERSVDIVIRGRASERIREMQETIRRIDQGKFGICGRCGGEIALLRLRLEPSSRLCTTCMAKLEKGIDRHAA